MKQAKAPMRLTKNEPKRRTVLHLPLIAYQALPTTCKKHPLIHISNIEMSGESTTYEQDGPEAKAIAKFLPYFPFKGIPRFYDIGGFLAAPEVFQNIVDIFASRYADIGIDSVAG